MFFSDRILIAAVSSVGALLGLLTPTPAAAQRWVFEQVAITGQAVPGATDGAVFAGSTSRLSTGFSAASINEAGDVAFVASVRTADGGFDAILGPTSGPGSALGLIARTGDVLPGTTDGLFFSGGDFGFFIRRAQPPILSLNDAGDVAFLARLQTGAGAEVTFDNDQAIFGPTAGPGSPLGLIAREGAPLPGVLDDAPIRSLFSPSLNNSGDVAFRASLPLGEGTAVIGPTAGPGSARGVIAREGELLESGALFFTLSGDPLLNNSGDVAFGVEAAGNGFAGVGDPIIGPIAGAGSPLGLVLAPGEAVPTDLTSPALNDAGDVAFVRGFGDALFGPTAGPGSELGLIAQRGDQAPGLPEGTTFGSIQGTLLNSSGDLVFGARLSGGETFFESAIFGVFDGEVELILRDGDLIEVTDPVTSIVEQREVRVSAIAGRGAPPPFFPFRLGREGFNDTGTLVLQLSFVDENGFLSSGGIFIARAIPEPASVALLALAAAGLAVRRRATMPA